MATHLGEFEQMVLLAVLRLRDEAYGLAVRQEMAAVAGRRPSSGALYTTLARLEEKGLLEPREDDPSPERGNRARRYVRLTPEGLEALRATRERLLALWEGFETVLEGS